MARFFVLVLCFCSGFAQAGQYHVCTDAAGKRSFQDKPCPAGAVAALGGVPDRPGEFDSLTAQERAALIKAQFSGWDGSHIALVEHVKTLMNDPASFEHVKTQYWDKGDYLLVQMSFRGENGFGGVVRDSASALVRLDGVVLQFIDQ